MRLIIHIWRNWRLLATSRVWEPTTWWRPRLRSASSRTSFPHPTPHCSSQAIIGFSLSSSALPPCTGHLLFGLRDISAPGSAPHPSARQSAKGAPSSALIGETPAGLSRVLQMRSPLSANRQQVSPRSRPRRSRPRQRRTSQRHRERSLRPHRASYLQ